MTDDVKRLLDAIEPFAQLYREPEFRRLMGTTRFGDRILSPQHWAAANEVWADISTRAPGAVPVTPESEADEADKRWKLRAHLAGCIAPAVTQMFGPMHLSNRQINSNGEGTKTIARITMQLVDALHAELMIDAIHPLSNQPKE